MKKTDKEWKNALTPEQYRVLREKGTEAPFSGKYVRFNDKGRYVCAACGNELFDSDAKFESGCGWPSFSDAKKGAVEFRRDLSHFMIRTEVICKKCGSHLGHVFDDGPKPSGKRFCINSVALDFTDRKTKKATFAAGCFWGVEAAFKKIKGVVSTTVGYTGGKAENPTYDDVCTGTTGHAESVLVEYDPEVVPYQRLLEVFWQIHNPTSFERQGNDSGSQYRAVVFYHDEGQKKAAIKSREEEQKKYKGKIMTEIARAGPFYEAEEYHQDYLDKNRGGYCHIDLGSIK